MMMGIFLSNSVGFDYRESGPVDCCQLTFCEAFGNTPKLFGDTVFVCLVHFIQCVGMTVVVHVTS